MRDPGNEVVFFFKNKIALPNQDVCFAITEYKRSGMPSLVPSAAIDDTAMSLTTNEGTDSKFRQAYAAVLLQIARNLDRDQQQELRFYYSRSGLSPVEDTGILTLLTSLEYAGMISWEDVGRLTEGLRQIQRLDLVKLLTEFELKRDLTVLLDFYTRKRLELDLCFRSNSVQSTAAYLLTETVRDEFDITNVRSLVGSGKSIKTVLNEFEEEIDRSELSSPWSKLTMLIVIAGEIIVAASADGIRHQNHQLMEMCSTAAEECSSRMIELGSWVS